MFGGCWFDFIEELLKALARAHLLAVLGVLNVGESRSAR